MTKLNLVFREDDIEGSELHEYLDLIVMMDAFEVLTVETAKKHGTKLRVNGSDYLIEYDGFAYTIYTDTETEMFRVINLLATGKLDAEQAQAYV